MRIEARTRSARCHIRKYNSIKENIMISRPLKTRVRL
jgi:hypothetical protein